MHLAPALVMVAQAVLNFVNSIKADGTFWGKLSADAAPAAKSLISRFWESLKGGERMDPAQTKKDFGEIGKAFNAAGEASESDKASLDLGTKEMFDKMLAMQKAMDDLNAHPKFEAPEVKEKAHRFHSAEDSLMKVGNFLGTSGSDSLTRIHQQQLHVLRNIEKNTRSKHHAKSAVLHESAVGPH
jgi:hypothetical protein